MKVQVLLEWREAKNIDTDQNNLGQKKRTEVRNRGEKVVRMEGRGSRRMLLKRRDLPAGIGSDVRRIEERVGHEEKRRLARQERRSMRAAPAPASDLRPSLQRQTFRPLDFYSSRPAKQI